MLLLCKGSVCIGIYHAVCGAHYCGHCWKHESHGQSLQNTCPDVCACNTYQSILANLALDLWILKHNRKKAVMGANQRVITRFRVEISDVDAGPCSVQWQLAQQHGP